MPTYRLKVLSGCVQCAVLVEHAHIHSRYFSDVDACVKLCISKLLLVENFV